MRGDKSPNPPSGSALYNSVKSMRLIVMGVHFFSKNQTRTFLMGLVQEFRSTAWTGQTFTTHTTLNIGQNQLAIKVSADN